MPARRCKALINEHLVSLGINPKIPPVELLSAEFIAARAAARAGNAEAKASEMEHAIRKHCKVHFDEDPVLYESLSEKLEALIQQYKDNWDVLSRASLRPAEGCRGRAEGRSRRASARRRHRSTT